MKKELRKLLFKDLDSIRDKMNDDEFIKFCLSSTGDKQITKIEWLKNNLTPNYLISEEMVKGYKKDILRYTQIIRDQKINDILNGI